MTFINSYLKHLPTALLCSVIAACGSGSNSSSENSTGVKDLCSQTVEGVNWEALLTENCPNLSDYNLFADPTDPTGEANSDGIPYSLSTPLFTDYATKYRYVFVPEGKSATYSDNEVMEFPVGSVLVKTFSLPEDTSQRGINETHIETRILINRADGWVALPYYWETTEDAKLLISGKTISNVTITHNNEQMTFDYGVPQASQCTSCHSVIPMLTGPEDTRQAIFKPIGPKARYLNFDYEYTEHTMNQLSHWSAQGILTGAPNDKTTIDTAPILKDETSIDTIIAAGELDVTARAYLDINCAHCHRSELTLPEPNYAGPAGDSGLNLEFNRDYDENPARFGVCKTAVAGGSDDEDEDGQPDYPRDVIPGYADKSYLWFRMNTTDPRHKMPELGRSTIHAEGVELIKEWINSLPQDDCGLDL